jgi:predicted MPP superfamily phosphohydrolase
MNLVWLTDLHLNFVDEARLEELLSEIRSKQPDAILISGDLAEAHHLAAYLHRLEWGLAQPIYFVLGNHDYYRGSIVAVRDSMERITRSSSRLKWLPALEVVSLSKSTALVGHDGWGDGRFGNAETTDILLNDFFLIEELQDRERPDLLAVLQQLGDEAAAHFRKLIPEALAEHDRVIVLTHVPPFAGAAWHQGKPSNDDWLPWFSCKAVGDVLLEAMQQHPEKSMLVLCGHTHGSGIFSPLPNLEVWTGGAVYGEPRVQRVIAA